MSDMNININPNPAKTITVDMTETFADFVNKVTERSQETLEFGNKAPIALEPDSKYVFLKMKVSEIITPEQFDALLPYLMNGILEATKAEIIPEELLQDFATAFNVATPPVPEQYVDDNHTIEMLLMGNTYLLTIRKQK